jgi:hypothetical protein
MIYAAAAFWKLLSTLLLGAAAALATTAGLGAVAALGDAALGAAAAAALGATALGVAALGVAAAATAALGDAVLGDAAPGDAVLGDAAPGDAVLGAVAAEALLDAYKYAPMTIRTTTTAAMRYTKSIVAHIYDGENTSCRGHCGGCARRYGNMACPFTGDRRVLAGAGWFAL